MTESEYIKLIGLNIKEIRESKNLRQIDLSNMLGIDDSSLRRLESGRTNPTFKTLFRISQVLEVSVCDLLKLSD
jgi:transcriptional regulator with XRE-family HTH domain